MASEPTCPICSADVPVTGDEKAGDEIYCAFCAAPLTVKAGADDEEMALEDDL